MSSTRSKMRSDHWAVEGRRTFGPNVSIIVPVFNEEPCLDELLTRISAVGALLGRSYELVLVNDGSRDRSLERLRRAALHDPRIVVIDLNRNYGQHAAVFAGFAAARGAIVVTMDADLQNPPEEIPRLLAKIDEGYDVVGTVRVHRHDTLFRRLASRLANRLTRLSTGARLSDYGCMLRAYRAEVVKALCAADEHSTFIPVLAEMYASRVTEVPVAHAERQRGTSKYNVGKLLLLQLDLLTSFSLIPLRATMAVGILTALVATLSAAVLVALRLLEGPDWAVSGVFTLFAVLFLFIGILLFAVGLVGEYVGRIYVQVRHRPRYVVRERITALSASEAP